ncbi:MAG TPA: 4Fe-4S dicluster domain-containing protein [Vicinamibacterales bacterium]|nr:4Fe-4S dicluster domain-containing protein [Vicinamibacterales bacterium]
MPFDRRAFLAETGRLLILTGAASVAWDYVQAGEPERAPNYDATTHWWAMVLDVEKCIGCGACVRACKAENGVSLSSSYFRTWIERYEVDPDDPEHPHVDSPNGGYDGFPAHRAAGMKTFFVPKMCNHCADSPCVQVCPVGATFITQDGVVLVDKEYCLGCRYCVQACPYGCRYIDPVTHTADKCTLCYHRITQGLQPACVEVCPTGTRYLGDLKNPADPIHEFLRTHRVQVLKPQMGTHPKAFYNGLDGSVR